MLNVTSRLAVEIKHVPEEDMSWTDTACQRIRSLLSVSEILLKRARYCMIVTSMELLVSKFKSLEGLKHTYGVPSSAAFWIKF